MKQGISFEEAQAIVLAATPVLGAETRAVSASLGRVLAEPVVSTRTLPPADCSAMDGFAVRSADLASVSATRPGSLPVVYEVAAGAQAPRPLAAGEAARIFTGAPLPPGADAVVRQEDCELGVGRVQIRVRPAPRDHVREAGEDLRAGDRVLEAGEVLHAAQVGLLASLGRGVVSVHRRPIVALLSGGDELVEPDGDVAGGRIVSSNSYTLAAQCQEIGAEPLYLGIAADRPQDIERRLRAGLTADCLVSSAGVSVGDHDHVREVLTRLGCRLAFWGVAIKPGYPVAFGRFEWSGAPAGAAAPIVFGLPGNPVSASVTFEQFVRPALLKMMGHGACFRPTLRARLDEDLDKKPGRLHFVRVCLERHGDEIFARSTGNQSSGVMSSLARAHGLLIFPAEQTSLARGSEVTVQLLDEGFLAGRERGF